MERRASEAAIGLLHDHHVDGARQRGSVDLAVELRDELADVVHGIHDCRGIALRVTTLILYRADRCDAAVLF